MAIGIYVWKVSEHRYDFSTWEKPLKGLAGESRKHATLTRTDISELVDSQGDLPRLNRLLDQIYIGASRSDE